jgi:hypothetical protein
MWAALRSGDWITGQRLRAYSLMLLAAYVIGALVWLVSLHNGLDWQNRPYGTDFAEVYAAGTLVAEGHPAAPYDLATHIARQHALFGASSAVFSWNYPPPFLALARALAGLPYLGAFLLWQALGFALYLAALRGIAKGPQALLLAAAFPGVFENYGHGQTGFLVAALMAGGLVCLDRRPLLAGVLFGLIAFKPHFGPLIPVALIAAGRGRAFAAATATVLAMALASLAAFGPEPWFAFAENFTHARLHGLEDSDTGTYKMQSAFAAVRLLGGSVGLAYAVHGMLLAATLAAVAGVWRSPVDRRLQWATLSTAAFLATPYAFDYDMMLLAPAIACMAVMGHERGFLPYEKSLLALAFAAPLFARPLALALGLPLGLLASLPLFALILRRAARAAKAAREAKAALT